MSKYTIATRILPGGREAYVSLTFYGARLCVPDVNDPISIKGEY